jgi:hypothetical protein
VSLFPSGSLVSLGLDPRVSGDIGRARSSDLRLTAPSEENKIVRGKQKLVSLGLDPRVSGDIGRARSSDLRLTASSEENTLLTRSSDLRLTAPSEENKIVRGKQKLVSLALDARVSG